MALPKLTRPFGLNVHYLGYYVKKRLASSDKLHFHGERAYKWQEQILDYDNQCYANNECPMCNVKFARVDDCDDQETRR